MDCSHHNIFDFLTRDPRNYMPVLSSAEISGARTISVGKYRIPIGKPRVKLLRKSRPFWKILGERGVFSSIIRVPITFPPEKFHGHCLSGMCTPDLRGSQGTFSYYTTKSAADAALRGRHAGAGDPRGRGDPQRGPRPPGHAPDAAEAS